MNLGDVVVWGFVATLLLSTLLAGSQALGQSRMALPFLLGTMLTSNRDRAAALGFGVHLVNGWLFAVVYAAAFESMGRATWWLGGAGGLLHGLVALLVILPFMPGFHPRMASERAGPTPTRLLQPPGFLGLNYGRRTPIIGLAAHISYGVVLGAFYSPLAAA
jgi:hypothetical protein